MTYLINDSCTIVTLGSDYLSPSNQSVNLFWSKNCGTVSKISINPLAGMIQLSPEDLGQTEKFSDGVYYFKISVTDGEGGMAEESLCKFINCNSTCLMLDKYKDETQFSKVMSFEALLASDNCIKCECSTLCMLYNNTGLNDTENDSDCGCK